MGKLLTAAEAGARGKSFTGGIDFKGLYHGSFIVVLLVLRRIKTSQFSTLRRLYHLKMLLQTKL